MNSLIAISLLSIIFWGSTTYVDSSHESYYKYKAQHSKLYLTEEENDFRYNIFLRSVEYINRENQIPTHKYKLGLNQFTDITSEEFMKSRLSSPILPQIQNPSYFVNYFWRKLDIFNNNNNNNNISVVNNNNNNNNFTDSLLKDKSVKFSTTYMTVDWYTEGYVTRVQDQKKCGSCYSFAAVGGVEFLNRKRGYLLEYSKSQITECSDDFGNLGCDGGTVPFSYRYLITKKKYCTEFDYPYNQYISGCQDSKCDKDDIIKSYKIVEPGDHTMQSAVAQSVIPTSMYATDLQYYQSGIYDKNDNSIPNHGVLIVGYGNEDGIPFWYVKNSWGTSWGEKGFFRIERISDVRGVCSITMGGVLPLDTIPELKSYTLYISFTFVILLILICLFVAPVFYFFCKSSEHRISSAQQTQNLL